MVDETLGEYHVGLDTFADIQVVRRETTDALVVLGIDTAVGDSGRVLHTPVLCLFEVVTVAASLALVSPSLVFVAVVDLLDGFAEEVIVLHTEFVVQLVLALDTRIPVGVKVFAVEGKVRETVAGRLVVFGFASETHVGHTTPGSTVVHIVTQTVGLVLVETLLTRETLVEVGVHFLAVLDAVG